MRSHNNYQRATVHKSPVARVGVKIAKCIPIYKGTPLDPYDPVNYRPISILTALNKIFERILHSQLSKYIEDNELLPKFQYGYRKQHNTSQTILDYSDKNYTDLD